MLQHDHNRYLHRQQNRTILKISSSPVIIRKLTEVVYLGFHAGNGQKFRLNPKTENRAKTAVNPINAPAAGLHKRSLKTKLFGCLDSPKMLCPPDA